MTTLNYIRTGPGDTRRTVVLLHSAGLDLTYWDAQIASLRDHHDVVAIDLPGHGSSPGTVDDVGIDAMAGAVATAISDITTKPIDLVGLSVGGLVAQEVTLAHPTVVNSLTLIDTAARFAPAGKTAMRTRAHAVREHGTSAILEGLFDHWFLPETRAKRPDLVDRATKTVASVDTEIQAALWEAIAGFDASQRLNRIEVPTLILVGEHDSSSPVSSAGELAALISGSTLSVIGDAAHLSPIEQPVTVTSHLLDFLRSTDGTAATPRISLVDPATLNGERAEQYERFPSNLTRTLLTLDHPLASQLPSTANALRSSSLDPAWREGIILRVAAAHGSEYERFHHFEQARHVGWSTAQIAAIEHDLEDGDLPGDFVSVLRFTDAVMSASTVSDAVFDAARAVLSDADIVTTLILIGHYMTVARIIGTLRIPLDDEPDSWTREH